MGLGKNLIEVPWKSLMQYPSGVSDQSEITCRADELNTILRGVACEMGCNLEEAVCLMVLLAVMKPFGSTDKTVEDIV